jgi:hypothetical protein
MGVQTTAPMFDKVLALQPSAESLLELDAPPVKIYPPMPQNVIRSMAPH